MSLLDSINIDTKSEGTSRRRLVKLLHFLKKKKKLFVKEIEEVKHKAKDIPGTNLTLAMRHFYARNINDAIMRFKIVGFIQGYNAEIYLGLARCMAVKKNRKKAEEYFHQVELLVKQNQKTAFIKQEILASERIEYIPEFILQEKMRFSIHDDYEKDELEELSLTISETEPAQDLVRHVLQNIEDKNPNLRVLDLSCKFGIVGQILKEKGVTRYIEGVDMDGLACAVANIRKVKQDRVFAKITRADPFSFLINFDLADADRRYDLVVACGLLEHVGGVNRLIKLLHPLLNKKAMLVLSIVKEEYRERKKQKEDEVTDWKYDIKKDLFFFNTQYVKNIVQSQGFSLLEHFSSDDKKHDILIFKLEK